MEYKDKQKAITQHVKQPDGQQLKSVYVWIIILFGGVIVALSGYIKMQDIRNDQKLDRKDEELRVCRADQVKMQEDFRKEWKEDIQQAQHEVIEKSLPMAEGRARRGAIFNGTISRILPNQTKNAQKIEELKKEIQKLQKHPSQ